MRSVWIFACIAIFSLGFVARPAAGQEPGAGEPAIQWEVKNRFRLFRRERDFLRHVAAFGTDGILAAEERLAKDSDGRGWAKDMVDGLCVDALGKLREFCDRDGQRELYLTPHDHHVAVGITNTAVDASCAWSFDDGEQTQQATTKCDEDVSLWIRYGRTTAVSVDITLADGTARRVSSEMQVRDFLIAGIGDSVASGDGNPDQPVALSHIGFCFRRFGGGARNEYFRPGRAGYTGNRACDSGSGGDGGRSNADWERHGARWMSAACHRSLYSYQVRTALALAVENPHIAVTYIPLACTGASIADGLFNSQRAREIVCESGAITSCLRTVPGQLSQLADLMELARRRQPDRNLDLVLLTIGANDIGFSGLVADVMIEAAAERMLFQRAGVIATLEQARRALATELPGNFAKLRAELKTMVGGDLSRIVFVSYGHPALSEGGAPCPGGLDGFDVHPAFAMNGERLRSVAAFVTDKFFSAVRALSLCESGVLCAHPATDRMTFVDGHQAAFVQHGFCARSPADPDFDRDCFSREGESFQRNLALAATDPLVCDQDPGEFRPYAPRSRWIRTANDSYFTAMTYPQGLSSALQPSDIHDATWGATSAVYGGAIHPTAQGHAAMADAALPAVRQVLGLLPSPSP
jgi:lysophospholipase L1-like esterase